MKFFILPVVFLLSSCGDLHRTSATEYADKAVDTLVEMKICENRNLCSKNKYVFWEGSQSIDSGVYINIYDISDEITAKQIQIGLMSIREEQETGFNLTVYSSSHGSDKVVIYKTSIQ